MVGGDKEDFTGTELDTEDPNDNSGGEGAETELENEEEAEGQETAEVLGDGEGEQPKPKTEGRAAKAIQELKKERNEERDRAKQLQDQLADILRRQTEQANSQNGVTEQQKLEAMEPTDRIAYLADKQAQGLQTQIARLQFQVQDTQDQAMFQAKVASDPLYAKYSEKVEGKLREMQGQGITAKRDDVLKYFVGQDLMAKRASSGVVKTKAAAASRVAAANGKTVSARSEISGGAKKGKTAEERLEGVII